jgi:hypothetical protein
VPKILLQDQVLYFLNKLKVILNLKKSSIFIQTMETILFLTIAIATAVCLGLYLYHPKEKIKWIGWWSMMLLWVIIGIWLSYK